jgi:hypothetical protein
LRFVIRVLGRAALLTASLPLAACVHEPDVFPTGWPAPRAGAACADVVGVFADEGEKAPDDSRPLGYTPRLSDVVFPRTNDDRVKYRKPDTLEISLKDSVYELRSLQGADVVRSMRFAESALPCKNGWLTVLARSGLPDTGPVAGYEDWAVMLHVADDGSLLVRSGGSITGLAFMVVPMHASGVHYSRFERRARSR